MTARLWVKTKIILQKGILVNSKQSQSKKLLNTCSYTSDRRSVITLQCCKDRNILWTFPALNTQLHHLFVLWDKSVGHARLPSMTKKVSYFSKKWVSWATGNRNSLGVGWGRPGLRKQHGNKSIWHVWHIFNGSVWLFVIKSLWPEWEGRNCIADNEFHHHTKSIVSQSPAIPMNHNPPEWQCVTYLWVNEGVAMSWMAISACSPYLLHIILNAFREVVVNYSMNVWLVDAHTKCNCCHYHTQLSTFKLFLNVSSLTGR